VSTVVTPAMIIAVGAVYLLEVTSVTTILAEDTSMVGESTLLLGTFPDATSGGIIPSAAVVSVNASPVVDSSAGGSVIGRLSSGVSRISTFSDSYP